MVLGTDCLAQFWVVLVGPCSVFTSQPLAGLCLGPSALQHPMNNLHAGLEGILSKFADDTRLGGAVGSPRGGGGPAERPQHTREVGNHQPCQV